VTMLKDIDTDQRQTCPLLFRRSMVDGSKRMVVRSARFEVATGVTAVCSSADSVTSKYVGSATFCDGETGLMTGCSSWTLVLSPTPFGPEPPGAPRLSSNFHVPITSGSIADNLRIFLQFSNVCHIQNLLSYVIISTTYYRCYFSC